MKNKYIIFLISTIVFSTSVFANSMSDKVIDLKIKQFQGKAYIEATQENLDTLKFLCAELEKMLLKTSSSNVITGGEKENMLQIEIVDDRQKFIEIVDKFYNAHNYLDSAEYKYTNEQSMDYAFNKIGGLERELEDIARIDGHDDMYGTFDMMLDSSRQWSVSTKELKEKDKARFEKWEKLFKIEYDKFLGASN